ncbi:MAG: TetR/AcrR family transcriptional regulator [Mycobacterium sp.]|nr:TetR/AcrR family transcriptional regulator [Mycobacterium sp.]
MDTTVTAGRTAGGDLTAKARIRNAALELHAAKGSDNTTLRDVASAAGVTSGLVIHHFGSKDGLRRAVQQYVVDQFRQAVDSVPPVGTPEEIGRARDEAVARMWAENPIFVRYLTRAVLENTGESDLLDLLADYTFAQLQQLRAAGIATSAHTAQTQAVGILLRELGPRILQPLVDHFWSRLNAGEPDCAPPRLEVRLRD